MATSALREGTTPSGQCYIATGPAESNVTLICIPGWVCRAADYSFLFQSLAKHNPELSAYAIDLPGHGNTPASLSPAATIPSYANLIHTFIAETKVSRPVLVGHSMGYRIALQAWVQGTAAQRKAIAGIVFLDGSTFKLQRTTYAYDTRDPRSQHLSAEEKLDLMTAAFTGMFSAATPEPYRAEALAHLRGVEFGHNVREREGLLDYDYDELEEALATFGREGVACPLMNLQSTALDAQNRRVTLKEGDISAWMKHLAEHVPGVKLGVVEQAGHFPHVDQPEVVRQKVIEFLGDL